MPDDSDLSNAAGKLTVITDLEYNPVTVDHNPAHFDGFLHEIAEWSQRTGKFLELLEHGITFRGSKNVVDSPAAIPFFQGKVTNARRRTAPTTLALLQSSESNIITMLLRLWALRTSCPTLATQMIPILSLTRSLSVPTTSP